MPPIMKCSPKSPKNSNVIGEKDKKSGALVQRPGELEITTFRPFFNPNQLPRVPKQQTFDVEGLHTSLNSEI